MRDIVETEFGQIYEQFVEGGGLDKPGSLVVDEDWERMEREQAYCKHSKPIQKCPTCRKDVKKYGQS